MIINLLSFIVFISADVPYCPTGTNVSKEDCNAVPGCHWDNTSSRTKSMCHINCTQLVTIEDCNDPRSSKCYWSDEYKSCYWVYNCGSPKTVEKCITHPSPELSCIWDTSDSSKQPYCRTAKCYDYDADPARCISDDNLECVLDKGWCRDLSCSEITNIESCRILVQESCAWQDNMCIQSPCPQLKTSSSCLNYGFCRWNNQTKCTKAQCESISEQGGCEGFYTEKYVDTCAWDTKKGLCYKGVKCTDFTTKIGCLVGGGPCAWVEESRCVDL